MEQGDYSSGLLIQLIFASFERQKLLALLPDDVSRRSNNPRVALPLKRQLLEPVYESCGAVPILQAGFDIQYIPAGPMSYALLGAADIMNLFNRWRHLERYFHSKHRVNLVAQQHDCLTLQHISKTADKPKIYEDLLIAGLLTGLLRRFGCSGVSLHFVKDNHQFEAALDGKIKQSLSLPSDCSSFRISWKSISKPASDMNPSIRQVNQITFLPGQGPYTRKLIELFWRDPLNRRNVATVADFFGLSSRSLQRRLSIEGCSFSKCILAARSQSAAAFITDTDISLTGIGFLAGYSDSAHFSREFKKAMGITPSQFKDALA
jgi:AraC-like DNA-binding protein